MSYHALALLLTYLKIVCYFQASATSPWTRSDDHVVACYIQGSSLLRMGDARFGIADVDASLCTDIIFGFVNISVERLTFETINEEHLDFLKELLRLKTKRSHLRVLLAVGGEEVGDVPFETISAKQSSLEDFASNVADELRHSGFDGFEVAWTTQDSSKKSTFTRLFEALFEAFQKESVNTGDKRLLLTLASLPHGVTPEPLYDPNALKKYLDRVTVLAFNYDSQGNPQLTHNNPLYPLQESLDTSCQRDSLKWWVLSGVPARKVIFGLAAFGRSVLVTNDRNSDSDESEFDKLRSLAQPGIPGEFTKSPGLLAYHEICRILEDSQWIRAWEYSWNAPVAHGSRGDSLEWVTYENPRSFKIKAKFAKEKGYGGIMIWSLDMDDFSGNFCISGTYPLLRGAASVYKNASLPQKTKGVGEIGLFLFGVAWLLCFFVLGFIFFYGKQMIETEHVEKFGSVTSRFF